MVSDKRGGGGQTPDQESAHSFWSSSTCEQVMSYANTLSQQLLSRNVEWFRGGLVFKAHRSLYHSNLVSRVIPKKKKGLWFRAYSAGAVINVKRISLVLGGPA